MKPEQALNILNQRKQGEQGSSAGRELSEAEISQGIQQLTREAGGVEEENSTPEQPRGVIDTVLDNQDFVEFLAKYPDSDTFELTESNESEIIARFRTFREKEDAKDNLISLYSEEIKSDLGLELDKESFGPINEYFETTAIYNQEELKEFLESYRTFKIERDRLAENIKRVHELLSDISPEELNQKIEDLEKLKGKNIFDSAVKFLTQGELRKQTLEKYGVARGDLDKVLDQENTRREALVQLAEAQTQMASQLRKMKGELLSEQFGPVFKVRNAVMEEVKGQLAFVEQNPNFENLEMTAKLVEGVEESSRKDKKGLIDYTASSGAQFQMLKASVEKMVKDVVGKAAEKAFGSIKANKLNEVEKRFKEILERNNIGGLGEGRTKEIVLEKLKEILDKTTDMPKKLLIKRLMIKISQQ